MANKPNNESSLERARAEEARLASSSKPNDVTPPATEPPKVEPPKVDTSAATQPAEPVKPEVPKVAPTSPKAKEAPTDEPTVVMHFPKRVILTVSSNERYKFEAGSRRVPVRLKDHKYLKANGAKEV